jgi:hypothetical protein
MVYYRGNQPYLICRVGPREWNWRMHRPWVTERMKVRGRPSLSSEALHIGKEA